MIEEPDAEINVVQRSDQLRFAGGKVGRNVKKIVMTDTTVGHSQLARAVTEWH